MAFSRSPKQPEQWLQFDDKVVSSIGSWEVRQHYIGVLSELLGCVVSFFMHSGYLPHK